MSLLTKKKQFAIFVSYSFNIFQIIVKIVEFSYNINMINMDII